jgi:hypothetical protein
MIKCSNLENKKEKNKNHVLIKANVSNRFFCFGTQDTIEGVCVFRIDNRTIKREKVWLSGYRVPLGEIILAYALGPSVLTI